MGNLRWIGLACLLLVLSSCGGDSNAGAPAFVLPTTELTNPQETEPRWATTSARRGNITALVELQGELIPIREEALLFATGGLIKTVYTEAGSAAREGEVIAELDTLALEQQFQTRNSELAIATLQLSALEARLPRSDLEGSTTNYELEIARERVKLAQVLYDIAQTQLEAAVLRAPFNGTVTNLALQRGSRVNAYETVGMFADTSDIFVRLMVPDTFMDIIADGIPASVQVEGRMYSGSISEISNNSMLWQGALAHEVSIRFDAGQTPPTHAHLNVEVVLTGESRDNVLLVPVDAVDTFPGQAYVDVVEDNMLQRVAVETGLSDGTHIEILSGLTEGQVVALP